MRIIKFATEVEGKLETNTELTYNTRYERCSELYVTDEFNFVYKGLVHEGGDVLDDIQITTPVLFERAELPKKKSKTQSKTVIKSVKSKVVPDLVKDTDSLLFKLDRKTDELFSYWNSSKDKTHSDRFVKKLNDTAVVVRELRMLVNKNKKKKK